ncbi:MAG TPA: hypothetical protein VGZ23_04475 [bacterium]|nr:hypothetical protein [bacterium]
MVTGESIEYVVLHATVNGLGREELEGELNRHAGNGYHIAPTLAPYTVMERKAKSETPDGRERE